VRVAWVVILSIFGIIFTILAILFIVKCLKKDDVEETQTSQQDESQDLLLNKSESKGSIR